MCRCPIKRMKSRIKGTVVMCGGLCWFAFAFGLGICLTQYVSEGAGVGFLGLRISGTALIGLVHVSGFIAAIGLCLVVGIGLCARGLVLVERTKEMGPAQPLSSPRQAIPTLLEIAAEKSFCRCVRCDQGLAEFVSVCPECGWTQPYGKAQPPDYSVPSNAL